MAWNLPSGTTLEHVDAAINDYDWRGELAHWQLTPEEQEASEVADAQARGVALVTYEVVPFAPGPMDPLDIAPF